VLVLAGNGGVELICFRHGHVATFNDFAQQVFAEKRIFILSGSMLTACVVERLHGWEF
jgi:hypothetical protein